MKAFKIYENLLSYGLLAFAIILYLYDTLLYDSLTSSSVYNSFTSSSVYNSFTSSSSSGGNSSGGSSSSGGRFLAEASENLALHTRENLAVHTGESEAQRAHSVIEFTLGLAEDASWGGNDPLIWLCMGVGFLLKFYTFIDQLFQPFMSLSIFVLSIRQVLQSYPLALTLALTTTLTLTLTPTLALPLTLTPTLTRCLVGSCSCSWPSFFSSSAPSSSQ